MHTVSSKDIKTTTILESKVDWLPWKTQTILSFEALTEDDIQNLEAKLNRITQERNEPYATLISRLNTSLVKFKNAGGVKSDSSLCATLRQAVHDDNQTVKITLETPAMMAMSYDDPISYLTALDPDENDPSTIVHGAHSAISSDNCAFETAGGDRNDRKPYYRRIDKTGPRNDTRGYRKSNNNDKYNKPYSDRGRNTQNDRDSSNDRYQRRYHDNRDDYYRPEYQEDRNRQRNYGNNDRYSHDNQRSQDRDSTYRSQDNRRHTRDGRKDKAMSAQFNDFPRSDRRIAFSAIDPTVDNKDVNDRPNRDPEREY
ncbi:hypothetical protein SARC_12302 [Sphaeroforma arctica JP610]|uniref:Uncharacterized protein n=1 Tax=Sphaeroforma arctica JP610 TaxID=667725 RepID=A0A0L0FEJ7_9EUKA|nr:hypothetical protein SARC_12302 [Sphaeroforma arctica JP610]KNC75165.1 hypothetical protein SARC_12302 [Sphaeroforma arctica JP610]|eukprot:XP_014149067.1 hypothetical protein SARC_12302 [Sphaeroforma arctica JP610]